MLLKSKGLICEAFTFRYATNQLPARLNDVRDAG